LRKRIRDSKAAGLRVPEVVLSMQYPKSQQANTDRR